MICKSSLSVISFFNESELICLHTGNSIVPTYLIGFNYFYRTLMILFHVTHLFAHSDVVISICY